MISVTLCADFRANLKRDASTGPWDRPELRPVGPSSARLLDLAKRTAHRFQIFAVPGGRQSGKRNNSGKHAELQNDRIRDRLRFTNAEQGKLEYTRDLIDAGIAGRRGQRGADAPQSRA